MEDPSQVFPALPLADKQDDAATNAYRHTELTLVEAAKHDREAFAALYQQFYARMYRYMRMRLPSEEDAADLTQQVFLKALDALPRYQQRGIPFAAWLFALARHVLADRFRQQAPTLPLYLAGNTQAEQKMEADVLRRESFEQLGALLSTLNVESRELLALRFAAGLTTPEIAQVIGKRPDAVRKSLSRLLQTLKEQYHASR